MADENAPPSEEEIPAKLSQLKLELNPEIPYHLQNLFPVLTGWFINGTIKNKATLIRALEPRLEEMLKPGEEVLYIAKGVRNSFAEAFFMGALWANLLNQTAFILTNARLLMIRTNTKGTPQNNFWVIYYSEIQKFKGSWTGGMELRLKDGRSMSFSGFPKTDRKLMSECFETALHDYREKGFEPTTTQSMETLCAYCYETVPKDEFDCEACGATYWKPSQLALRSLIFPSWGDFLMGHTMLACFELLGYAAGLLFLVIPTILTMLSGRQAQVIAGVIVLAMYFFFAHVVDAIVTYTVARKGLNPRTGSTS